jgi:sensor histidine kinase YesM
LTADALQPRFLFPFSKKEEKISHMDYKLSRSHWIAIFTITVIPVLFFAIRAYITEESVTSPNSLAGIPMLASLLFSFTITTLLYTGNLYLMRYLNRHLPWQTQPVKRLLIQAPFAVLYPGSMMALVYSLYARLTPKAVLTAEALFQNIFIAIVITLIVSAIIEGFYFFKRWNQQQLEAEQLKRENLQARFEALRNQVRPHFLFNSLNVLSSLVHKDPELAEDFIEQLSEVYRYVLDTADQNLVTVEQDLKAVEAYVFLQQTRYGAHSLQFHHELDGDTQHAWIPPLTLQMLVENAVKHNIASKQKPLCISLKPLAGHNLLLQNNKQKRTDQRASTGLGLENLQSRFSLVSDRTPTFKEAEDSFKAYIPMIA